jgi:translation initiation factor 1
MKDAQDKPKTLLFLAKAAADCRLAQLLFDAEARKNDVFWNASGKPLVMTGEPLSETQQSILKNFEIDPSHFQGETQAVAVDDLKNADMVILLQGSADADLRKLFPAWSGTSETWKISSAFEKADDLKQNISSLIIKLILKGGKRAPVPVQVETTDSPISTADKANARVRVCLESKGRKGKKVTTITGLPLNDDDLEKLGAQMKQACGSGGTVKDGVIEVQGNHCDKLLSELQKLGYKAKRSGG